MNKIAFLFLLSLSSFSWADKSDVPLAFTMTSFRRGELKEHCESRLHRAHKIGFRTVTLTPAFLVNVDGTALAKAGHQPIEPGEIEMCLKMADSMGFSIIYSPHLEHADTLAGVHEYVWRANFDFVPNTEYLNQVFGEWITWINSRPENGQKRLTYAVVASELERSIAKHAKDWLIVVASINERINQAKAGGTANQVHMGINFNWEVLFQLEESQCDSYFKMLDQIDFAAFSLYGNFRRAIRHESRFDGSLEVAKRSLMNRASRCSRESHTSLGKMPKLAIGEFGVGGSISRSYADVAAPKWRRARWIRERRAIFNTLFSWLKKKSDLEFVALWTIGVFDPFGIHEFDQPTRIIDPKIKFDLFRN